MRAWMIAALALVPVGAAAQDWVRQDETGIRAALANRTLRFDPYTTQFFGKAGNTRFITERAADGRWEVREGRYCSVWPPAEVWNCYDLYTAGNRVLFVSADGSESTGVLIE